MVIASQFAATLRAVELKLSQNFVTYAMSFKKEKTFASLNFRINFELIAPRETKTKVSQKFRKNIFLTNGSPIRSSSSDE